MLPSNASEFETVSPSPKKSGIRAGGLVLTIVLALALVASGRAAPGTHVYRLTASSSSPSPSPVSSDARNPETVVDLPTIGSVSWTCKGGQPLKFSTTFLAANAATERVSYSLDGAALVSKTLQPGQHLSTPVTGHTGSHAPQSTHSSGWM